MFYRTSRKNFFPLIPSIFIFSIVILSSFLFNACKTSKKVTKPKREKLEAKTVEELLRHLHTNELHYSWFSAKFSADVVINGKSFSFNGNIRSRKDSALWIFISPILGIDAGRVLATSDSVKIINKLQSTYFIGNFSYLAKLLNTEIDFNMLQSILTGNSTDFYEEEEKLKEDIDNYEYLLSTVKKRKLKRLMQRSNYKEPLQSIWIDPDSYKISRILIKDFDSDQSFEAKYSDFEMEDSVLVPHKLEFDIKAKTTMNIKISYSKITINKPQTFPFTIPSGYDYSPQLFSAPKD